MQIHALEVQNMSEWKIVDGRRMAVETRALAPSGTTSISHALGTFEVDETGTFDVPEEVGQELVGKTLGGILWEAGVNPFADSGDRDLEQVSTKTAAPRKRAARPRTAAKK